MHRKTEKKNRLLNDNPSQVSIQHEDHKNFEPEIYDTFFFNGQWWKNIECDKNKNLTNDWKKFKLFPTSDFFSLESRELYMKKIYQPKYQQFFIIITYKQPEIDKIAE